MTTWRVLKVFAGAEFEVAGRMTTDGAGVYLPAFTERRRNRYGHRNDIREVRRVMWPGYLLANFARMEEIVPDFSPQAYTRTLGVGRRGAQVLDGAPLSDAQVEAVRATQWLIESVSDKTVIKKGALVEFWRDVMKGTRAEVLRVRGQKAVVALLGSEKELHVSITDLENIPRVAGT